MGNNRIISFKGECNNCYSKFTINIETECPETYDKNKIKCIMCFDSDIDLKYDSQMISKPNDLEIKMSYEKMKTILVNILRETIMQDYTLAKRDAMARTIIAVLLK